MSDADRDNILARGKEIILAHVKRFSVNGYLDSSVGLVTVESANKVLCNCGSVTHVRLNGTLEVGSPFL